MLTYIGWINSISSAIIFFFGCIFGVYLILRGKSSKARLIIIAGLFILFSGLGHLGNFLDFLTILLTNNNLSNPYLLYYLYVIFAPPLLLCVFYLAAEFIIPQKKWYIFSILAILLLIWIILVIIDPVNSFDLKMPINPGEDLIDDTLKTDSLASILAIIITIIILIFTIIGFSFKIHQSEGLLRKKYIYLALGFILWFVFYAFLDSIIDPGIILYIVRISVIVSFIFLFLGLREESEEPRKKPKKQVKIEGGLFRLTKRPDHITEEEVIFHKEKKICLVCKGKAIGFNIYVCPQCNALYCQNCARELTELENACWVCDSPFDESKPSKLFQKEEELKQKISEGNEKQSKG